MVFSSTIFLFLFLPIVLAAYFIAPARVRNLVLLVASLWFYAWGETVYAALIVASGAMNYVFGRWVSRARERGDSRFALWVAVAANLGLLGWFKYAGFVSENLAAVSRHLGLGRLEPIDVHLPIGISFFTFQALCYVIDVHRGVVRRERSFLNLALYITLFPQLIAGPIVRFRDIADALHERHPRLADVAAGIRRFTVGLGKKVLIANTVAEVADSIFAIDPVHITPSLAWLGALSYAIQIYFDFSGYSDMAIGLGRIFGFRFPENFNYPYISRSLTDFWHRWHISLSTWFRDYVYISLGGNRRGGTRTLCNLVTVFALCGLWHGAAWNFLAWGLYHGLFLVIERSFRSRARFPALLRGAGHVYALLVVAAGWVIFRGESPAQIAVLLKALLGFAPGTGELFYAQMYLDRPQLLALAAGVVGSMPIWPWLRGLRWARTPRPALAELARVAALLLAVVLLLASSMQIASGTHNPFIYFRF